jgi:hypothetical protein
VPLELRSFRNTDTEALCRVFNAHYQAVGLPYALSPLSLELCVLAKSYFSLEQLLLAVVDGEPVGFVLLGFEPADDLRSLDETRAVISGLCVVPREDDGAIANQLIGAATRVAVSHGATQLRFCPPPPASPYLAGLAPGDAMIGCPAADARQGQWLADAGWIAGETVVYWDIDLAQFQPPVDRMQIQIRRMAHVDRLLDEPLLPWYLANMLGHAEQIGFQLTARDTRSVTADIVLWTIGHELLPQPDVIARLWPLEPADCQRSQDQLIFLLSEAFRQLRLDRVDGVRTVSKTRDVEVSRLLERIGFQMLCHGTVFSATI